MDTVKTIEARMSFRTLPRGGWKWVGRGQRRGYWRVIVGPKGAVDLRSPDTWEAWKGPQGIQGVTERSRYCLEASQAAAAKIAAAVNRVLRDEDLDTDDSRFLSMIPPKSWERIQALSSAT